MPLLVVSLAFTCLFLTLHVMAIRNEILRRRIARLTARSRRGRSACAGICDERRVMGDPHSGFIIAAYAIAGGTIAAMIGWLVVDFRRLSAQLNQATRALESARGAQMARAPMRLG